MLCQCPQGSHFCWPPVLLALCLVWSFWALLGQLLPRSLLCFVLKFWNQTSPMWVIQLVSLKWGKKMIVSLWLSCCPFHPQAREDPSDLEVPALRKPSIHTGLPKIIALTRPTFVGKVMSLSFNTLSRFLMAFLPRSRRPLISWWQSPFALILEPKKIKSVTVSSSLCHEVMGSSFSECWVLSQVFHSPLSLSSSGSLVLLHFLPLGWYHLHIWGCWYFSWQAWF